MPPLVHHTTHVVHPAQSVHVAVNTSGTTLPSKPCATRFVGDPHRGLDVLVSLCPTVPRHHTTLPTRASPSIALCIPPVYTLQFDTVRAHIQHHRQAGVNAGTFLYVAEESIYRSWRFDAALQVQMLFLPWLAAFFLHQRGQNWQINDCIHRAASQGIDWTLNIDIDEWLCLGLFGSLAELIRRVAGASTDVLTFGSRASVRFDAKMAASEPIYCLPCKRGVCIVDGRVTPRDLCTRHHGRRKHLLRTRSVWVANIHYVDHCKPRYDGTESELSRAAIPCRVHDLNASETWLLHANVALARGHQVTYVGQDKLFQGNVTDGVELAYGIR